MYCDARNDTPKNKTETLHRKSKSLQRAFYMFFLVLIQERTKENQGIKARPITGSGFYASACFFRSIPSQGKVLG